MKKVIDKTLISYKINSGMDMHKPRPVDKNCPGAFSLPRAFFIPIEKSHFVALFFVSWRRDRVPVRLDCERIR